MPVHVKIAVFWNGSSFLQNVGAFLPAAQQHIPEDSNLKEHLSTHKYTEHREECLLFV
jgi:hypothetical protein